MVLQAETTLQQIKDTVPSLQHIRWTWKPQNPRRAHRARAPTQDGSEPSALLHLDLTALPAQPLGPIVGNVAALLRAPGIALSLQRFSLNSNGPDCAALGELWRALMACQQLTELDLRHCFLDQDSFADGTLLTMLQTVPISSLYLSNNPLGDAGVLVLANGLRDTRLRELYLNNVGLVEEGEFISAPGAKALADLLQASKHLRVLALNENGIGSQGAKALASALPSSRLEQLLLSANARLDGKRFADAAERHLTLTSLMLPTTLPYEQLMATRKAVEANRRGKPLVAALQRLAFSKLFAERLNWAVDSEIIDALGQDVLSTLFETVSVGPAERVMTKFARARGQRESAYDRALRLAASECGTRQGGAAITSATTTTAALPEYKTSGASWVDNSAFMIAVGQNCKD